MGSFSQPTRILTLSSTTTPALITASYKSSNVKGKGYGVPRSTLVMLEATRANGSSMTGVKFQIVVSRTGEDGTWVPVLSVRCGDATGTPAYEHTVSVSNDSTSYDGLQTTNTRDWPYIDVQAKAVGASAGAGDSAGAWLPPVA